MPNQRKRRKLTFILLITVACLGLLFVAARYFVFDLIRKNIQTRIVALKESGIDITFDRANLDLWTGSVQIVGLGVVIGQEETRELVAKVPYLVVSDISLMKVILDKNLVIEKIRLNQPDITIKNRLKLPSRESQKAALENIYLNELIIPGLIVEWQDSTGASIMKGNGDLNLKNLGLENTVGGLTWKDADLRLEKLNVDMPSSNFAFNIKSLYLTLSDSTLQMDSLTFSPTVSRAEYMKAAGKQTDYIKGVLPLLKIRGLQVRSYPDPRITAETVDMSFFIDVFRDKRYPFLKTKTSVIPNHFVHRLPFEFIVERIRVKDSFVSFEEFPEEGDSAGHIFFKGLNAVVKDANNVGYPSNEFVMVARSQFMGNGDLQATFTFPLDTLKPNTVRGTIKNMSLPSLNAMITPAVKARITSGDLDQLAFHFNYNMHRAWGELLLDYNDLRIVTLKEKGDGIKISGFKSFLLNALVIKKDMDEDVPLEKKTGEINFLRDQKRSVFNYWWKSILSGLKSAYNIDKLERLQEDGKFKPLRLFKKDKKATP